MGTDGITLLVGDVRERLAELPEGSVHCCVTSPPYWGLRDYGTGTWEGGDTGCDHKNRHGLQGRSQQRANRTFTGAQNSYREQCRKCGARRIDKQMGSEPTIEEYLANMTAVFREVRRVLHPSGILWLNMGDSYANDGKFGGETGGKQSYLPDHDRRRDGREKRRTGLKPKDLCMLPARLAMALQADGWYLRSMIPWLKRNPMPESCSDRPTTACEYVFLLTKRQRYFYDGEAVRVEAEYGYRDTRGTWRGGAYVNQRGAQDNSQHSNAPTSVTGKHPETGRARRNADWFFESWQGLYSEDPAEPLALVVNPQAYRGSHFATFPAKLVEPLILAGTSAKGVCPKCGEPWRRIVKLTPEYAELLASGKAWRTNEGKPDSFTNRQPKDHPAVVPAKNETLGWRPGCKHDLPPEPATVLDPFAGSGTTLWVANALGRRTIAIELNPDYVRLIKERLGLFAPTDH